MFVTAVDHHTRRLVDLVFVRSKDVLSVVSLARKRRSPTTMEVLLYLPVLDCLLSMDRGHLISSQQVFPGISSPLLPHHSLVST